MFSNEDAVSVGHQVEGSWIHWSVVGQMILLQHVVLCWAQKQTTKQGVE